jgi:hypothetical protein
MTGSMPSAATPTGDVIANPKIRPKAIPKA